MRASFPLEHYTAEKDSVAYVRSLLFVRRGGRRHGSVWDIWELSIRQANVSWSSEAVLGVIISGCVDCPHDHWVNCFTSNCCQWTSNRLGQLAFSEETGNMYRLSSVLRKLWESSYKYVLLHSHYMFKQGLPFQLLTGVRLKQRFSQIDSL